MLDTDTVSYALRGHGKVGEHILEHAPSELCISAVTEAELRFCADLRKSQKLHKLIDTFSASIAVIALDHEAAVSFGKIASRLVAKGRPIGQYDTLIAAHALSLGVTLVTNNEKHFGKVAGLRLANWVN